MRFQSRLEKIRHSARDLNAATAELRMIKDKIEAVRDAKSNIIDTSGSSQPDFSDSDPTGEKAIKADEILKKYRNDRIRLSNEILQLNEEIIKCGDELRKHYNNGKIKKTEHQVLKFFYIEGLSIFATAKAVSYSVAQTNRYKREALDKLNKEQ